MLKWLNKGPIDAFLLAVGAALALAALLPARGSAAAVMSVIARAAIAMLFFLYGLRLSPQQTWQGVRQWRLHLLVLGTTFVIFPVLGLAARVLVPSVLTPELYEGLLFLCLVPSTMQSAVAFTSIARGHVSAAIVGASLSNLLGLVLTPLLAVLLMNTGAGFHINGGAIVEIVLQLLVPFGLGQLVQSLLAPVVARRAAMIKILERGFILLVVYAAYSMGMAERIWARVDPWQLVSVAVVAAVLLGLVLTCTTVLGRLVRLDRGDSIALLFCGSMKSLASGLPIAWVFFDAATVGLVMLPVMLFHQIQLLVCSLIATKLGREAASAETASDEANV